ncbi:MAG: ATP synthase F1 subunit delta [Deltaproteobacteria bacterium]|nr:ATP synthase F1 subunit delta [Deltaproteobacteria bacterium]
MSSAAVAKRWAGALLRIGVKKNAFERYGQELDAVAGALDAHLAVLAGPLVKKEDKKTALTEAGDAAGLSADVRHFLMLLVDKGRLAALPAIAAAYRELADEAADKVTAHVASATPLDEAALGQLRVKLRKRLGKNVTIETVTDPSLIGGLRTRVGSLVIDGSLAGHLERFAGQLGKE